jgi:hypothetical protein
MMAFKARIAFPSGAGMTAMGCEAAISELSLGPIG